VSSVNSKFDKDLRQRIERLRDKYARHDQVALEMLYIRYNDWEKVAPGVLNKEHPKPIVANLIDVYAEHAKAALSPLPAFRCRASSLGAPEKAKKAADKRTLIVENYLEKSKVQKQMQAAADGFYMYGLIVASVVPNIEGQCVDIRFRDPFSWYPVWDWKGDTVEIAHIFRRRIVDLAAEYPESQEILLSYRQDKNSGEIINHEVEVYYHDDGKMISIMVPNLGGLVLAQQKNPIGRCMTHAATAAGPDGEVRGALDNLGWVQIARHETQIGSLEAIFDAIEAPYVVPMDVGEVAIGPGSVIRTNNPQGAGRLSMNLPQGAFTAIQHLKEEMQTGAITPEALGGSIDASVVTGKGVQQLMAGYSQQIAMRQETLVQFFKNVIHTALKTDEAVWPDREVRTSGYKEGNEYSLKYTPSKDIAGYYEVDIAYGTATGLDPNRALVYELQLLGARLHSKDTVLRELPGKVSPIDELRKIQVEEARDALMQAVAGLAQAIPGMAAQGQDPSQTVSKIAMFVNLLEKGQPLEEIAVKVFPEPEPQPQGPASPDEMAMQQLQQAMGGGGLPMEAGADAAPPGAAPAGAGGQRPSLEGLVASLTQGGDPSLGATAAAPPL
jgi:hypothetical protein